jgi:hypothetical protein
MNGRLIRMIPVKDMKTELDISTLQPGVYIIKLSTDNGFAIKRIIKE